MRSFLKRKNLAVLTLAIMLTFLLAFALALSCVRKPAAAAEGSEEGGTPASFANAITVNNDGWMSGDFATIKTRVKDGVTYSDSIQIKVNNHNGAYLKHAEKGSNLAEKLLFWTQIKEETEYSWHSVKSLIETTATNGMKYVSEVLVRGDLMCIRFETVWDDNEANREFIPLDVKAIKLEAGMEWPKFDSTNHSGDQWNDNPNGDYNIPSGTHGVNQDIVIQFTQYNNGTTGGDNCDKFISYAELGASDTLTVKTQPTKTTYLVDEFDPTGLVLSANGQDIPAYASMVEIDASAFDTEGEKSVTVNYGGKTVAVNVTVTNFNVDHIRVTAEPTKKDYKTGEALDKTGLVVTAYNAEDEAAADHMDATAGCELSGYDATKTGNQTVTVTYSSKTATFSVTVSAPEITHYITFDETLQPFHDESATSEVNGVNVGHTLEVKMKDMDNNQSGYKNDGYLYGVEQKTNQETHIELYCKVDGVWGWKTVKELKEKKDANGCSYIARTAQRKNIFQFYFDTFYNGTGTAPTKEFTPLDVKAIKFKAGMQWGALYGNTDWVNGGANAIMPGSAGIQDDIMLQVDQLYHGNASATSCDKFSYYLTLSGSDTLTVKSNPKTTYIEGEKFDPSTLVLTATQGSKSVDVYGEAGMLKFGKAENNLSYELPTLQAGDTAVMLEWGGKQISIPVKVIFNPQRLEVVENPTKVEYDLGKVKTLDPSGLKVKAFRDAQDTTGVELAVEDLTISGFDGFVAGEQTITVAYGIGEQEKTTTFTVTVVDRNPNAKMTFYHGSPVTITDQAGTLGVRFKFENITPQTGFWSLNYVSAVSNAADKIFVKASDEYTAGKIEVGKWYSVRELMNITDENNMKYVDRVSQFGETLLLHLDTYYAGENPTREFTLDHIAGVKIEAGLYYVEYTKNNWAVLTNSKLRWQGILFLKTLFCARRLNWK